MFYRRRSATGTGGKALAGSLILVAAVLALAVMGAIGVSASQSSTLCGATGATPVSAAGAGGWQTVGATLDPTAGQAPTFSDHGGMSFAELLVAGTNAGSWQQDLSAVLGLPNPAGGHGMPMETALLIRMPGSSKVFKIWKNDNGSGQAGDPHYKIDLHPAIATALGFSGKQDVQVAVPANGGVVSDPNVTGNAGFVNDVPTGSQSCYSAASAPFTPGDAAKIQPDGTASVPASAPPAVQMAIIGANSIITKPYPSPDVHYGPLSAPWPAYDCSGAVSYALWRGGLHSVNAEVSGALESWGQPGPGSWITVYANAGHTWVAIAGLAFDTAHFGPTFPPGTGPRWVANPTGNLADGLSYVQRHPPGL